VGRVLIKEGLMLSFGTPFLIKASQLSLKDGSLLLFVGTVMLKEGVLLSFGTPFLIKVGQHSLKDGSLLLLACRV